MPEMPRKSSQEIEIDHLLAEEFWCDATFSERFLSACGIDCPGFKVDEAIAEPSFSGVGGYGDLLVTGRQGNKKVAILVEDKITASPATRQAERYAAHAEQMREQEWNEVWCVLVAPAAYVGERDQYDASIDLETVAELLSSADERRREFRRGIIARALKKKATSGVQVPDLAVHQLKADYLGFMADWCRRTGHKFAFPALQDQYYDGDSWVYPITDPLLPSHVYLRHRMWTKLKDPHGQMDLIAMPASEAEMLRFREQAPEGTVTDLFGKAKTGVQISILLPEMRQSEGFQTEIGEMACDAMVRLRDWYLSGGTPGKNG